MQGCFSNVSEVFDSLTLTSSSTFICFPVTIQVLTAYLNRSTPALSGAVYFLPTLMGSFVPYKVAATEEEPFSRIQSAFAM